MANSFDAKRGSCRNVQLITAKLIPNPYRPDIAFLLACLHFDHDHAGTEVVREAEGYLHKVGDGGESYIFCIHVDALTDAVKQINFDDRG